jgi:hypothetical protein
MPSDEEVTQRAGSLRSMTGLTAQEFEALLPPVEHAFVAYMPDHTIEGQPRTIRCYRTYDTSYGSRTDRQSPDTHHLGNSR